MFEYFGMKNSQLVINFQQFKQILSPRYSVPFEKQQLVKSSDVSILVLLEQMVDAIVNNFFTISSKRQ